MLCIIWGKNLLFTMQNYITAVVYAKFHTVVYAPLKYNANNTFYLIYFTDNYIDTTVVPHSFKFKCIHPMYVIQYSYCENNVLKYIMINIHYKY